MNCDLPDDCGLPSLSGDVARADVKTRAVFEKEYAAVVLAVADGLAGKAETRMSRAIVMTALLAGGVTLARAMKSKAMRERVAHAVRDAVVAVAQG